LAKFQENPKTRSTHPI